VGRLRGLDNPEAGTEMSLATVVWNLERAMGPMGSTVLFEQLAYS